MESKIVFRNDDVNPNTNIDKLNELYNDISERYDSIMLSGITLFCYRNNTEAIYPDLPLKDKNNKYLYNVNKLMSKNISIPGVIASHGMVHIKHSSLSKDAQEMSILSSCNYLGSNKFIAPFNDFNKDTIDICKENHIDLINNQFNWKCMEYNKFDSSHKFWYWHSWRWSANYLKEYLDADIANSKLVG